MEVGVVGRKHSSSQLSTWLTEPRNNQLRVISIEGPGGIGKTTLVQEVLRALRLEDQGFSVLEMRGADFMVDSEPNDPVSVLYAVAERALEQIPSKKQQYFVQTRLLKTSNDQLEADLEKKLVAFDDLTEAAKIAARMFIRGGRALGQYSPKMRDRFKLDNLAKVDEDHAEQVIDDLRKLSQLGSGVIDSFKRMTLTSARNRDALAKDAPRAMCEAFYKDLTALLRGYEKKDFFKFLSSKVRELKKLLFFVDDYESMQNDFGQVFFASHLVPRLMGAEFQSILLISGRDKLSATHQNWERFCGNELRSHTITLDPLTFDDIVEILKTTKCSRDKMEIAQEIHRETEGYPLLIQMAIEEVESGGRSALDLKKFYDRQTQWMSLRQRKWFDNLCFLEKVDLDTIPLVLSEENGQDILEWFKTEGSIRDTRASDWTVRPFVRGRALDYLRAGWPSEYERLKAKAESG